MNVNPIVQVQFISGKLLFLVMLNFNDVKWYFQFNVYLYRLGILHTKLYFWLHLIQDYRY